MSVVYFNLMSEHLLHAVAHHEAAHAVIALQLGCGVASVSIIPDDNSLGRVHNAPADGERSPDQCAAPIVSLAGGIAHRRIEPTVDMRGSSDHENALAFIRTMTSSGRAEAALVAFCIAEASSSSTRTGRPFGSSRAPFLRRRRSPARS